MGELEVLVDGASALGVPLGDAQLAQCGTYLAGLAAWNSRVNLTSRSALADAERVHLLDSLTVVPIITRKQPSADRLVDVGSGAGFPGLMVKIAMPDLRVVLVEAARRKAEFLEWLVSDLGLSGVEVVAERAESTGRREGYRASFDVATARAVGPLPVVLELTLPFCRPGGLVIASRGGSADEEAEQAAGAARELGGGAPQVERPDLLRLVPGFAENTALLTVEKIAETPDRYPRRPGIHAKRPLP